MIPTLFLARYRDLAADVAARPEEAIVASGGLADAIIRAALRNGAGAFSRNLDTIETFARRAVNDANEYPRVASDDERRLAMRGAARALADLQIDAQRIGAMLERSYRDVRDSGITVDEFESRMRKASVRNRRRTEAMVRGWREYEKLIAAIGAVDPADVLLRAAALIEQGAAVPMKVVAGFYDMTGAQLRVVHALASAGKLAAIYVPAGSEETYAFANRFVSALPPAKPPAVPLNGTALHILAPATSVTIHENSFAELRDVCVAVKQSIDSGTAPASIAIVARSLAPHDLHLIRRFAAEEGFVTSITESIPLVAHRIGRAVATLLRLRDRGFPRAEVIEVLRDGFRASKRLSLDAVNAVDMATRKANIAYGDSEAVRARAADYADALAGIEPFSPANALTGASWSDLLRRALDHFRIETEADAGAIEAITDVAAMLKRADAWRRKFDVNTVTDLLERKTLDLRPPAPDSPVVWVGDLMRFRGRTFDHVFVVRMEDDLFPQRRNEDPLLPDFDRRALGLREIGDGRDEERLLFQLLSDGATNRIHFNTASSDGIGKMIRPSRYLRAFSVQRSEFGERAKFNHTEHRTPNSLRQLQLIAQAGTRSQFDGYLAINDAINQRITDAMQKLSPTQLEDFGECPHKFLLKHILGVRELDEPERELHVNAKDKGSIDHDILEHFYSTLTDHEIESAAATLPQLPPLLRERLESAIDAAYDELETTMPPFNPTMRDIERRSTKRHLLAFVADDFSDLLALDLRPRHFEYEVSTQSSGLSIRGRIDRIDTGASKVRVVDYKSGKALRHTKLAEKIDRGVRMQLALYATAVADAFGTEVSGAIKPLRGGAGARFSFDLADHRDKLRETIDLFLGAMRRGEFPTYPIESDDLNSCSYCPVNHSCRSLHNDAERYSILRSPDARTLLGGSTE